MANQVTESLSRVMDDDAESTTLRETLDKILDDDELHGTWRRYHAYSAVLRGDTVQPVRVNQSWAALVAKYEQFTDLDDGVPKTQIIPFRSLLASGTRRTALGFVTAIAASCLLSFAFVLTFYNELGFGPKPESTVASTTRAADALPSPAAYIPSDTTEIVREAQLSEQDRLRADRFIVSHSQNKVSTPVPVRLVRTVSTTPPPPAR